MRSNLSPRAKLESRKKSTILIEANYEHTNVHTPKLIQWNQVSFPDTWTMKNVIPLRHIVPRTQPIEIIEDTTGHAGIIFKRREPRSISRRSMSSIQESRSSKLERQPSLRGVDWARIIPKAQYETGSVSGTVVEKLESPPMSPTPSDMAPPVSPGIRRQI